MQTPIRTQLLAAIVLFMSNSLFAHPVSPRPVSLLSSRFLTTIKYADSSFNAAAANIASAEARKKPAKLCFCQILNLKSNNYDHQNVAVLAEKTNNGHFSSDFGAAKEAIEKEKKHLRELFYDKLKVVTRFSAPTDCKSLSRRLKAANESLVVYDILNADIH